ncbi:MAG TPA: dienelactone hydrolase family protein [Mycobacteriales bacterium]|nr:dienelactone hydrolase family protein [Mycobacteriales bacterium]
MAEKVEFASNGAGAEGYLALPPAGSGPAVIVIQEWWGLVPHIHALVERLAGEGFLALAPDLYHGVATREPDEAGKLMMALEIPRAAADIAGAADYLAARDETAGGIGVVGFCMGGTLALWTPTVSDRVVAAAGFYPAPFRGWADLDAQWARYHGKSAVIHAAEGDGGSGAGNVTDAVAAITAAGGEVSVYDYPGSQHAFFNDTRPEVYHPSAAATAWQRTVEFFRGTLA